MILCAAVNVAAASTSSVRQGVSRACEVSPQGHGDIAAPARQATRIRVILSQTPKPGPGPSIASLPRDLTLAVVRAAASRSHMLRLLRALQPGGTTTAGKSESVGGKANHALISKRESHCPTPKQGSQKQICPHPLPTAPRPAHRNPQTTPATRPVSLVRLSARRSR